MQGRPIKTDAIIRTGKRLLLWLTQSDSERLTNIAKALETSKADAVRRLIREFNLEK